MSINDNNDVGFVHTAFVPHDSSVHRYFCWSGLENVALPYEFSGWRNETLSWKKNCYIHAGLSDACEAVTVKGPDAEKLLSYMCVNNFNIEKFPVGKAKHVIACTPVGNISCHGVCLRIAEDEFETYFMSPLVDYHMTSGKFNVEPYENDYTKDFVFQLAGPKSLEIVENAIKRDIHDLKFMQFTNVDILGYPVRILRMGMGGSLAYEVHGSTEHIFEIYNEIIRVGKPYGITKLGGFSYMCNHTENGFPQADEHFISDFETDPEIAAFMESFYSQDVESTIDYEEYVMGSALQGSLADEGKAAYFCNPIEAGWEKMIYWDHEFIGKEALKKIAEDPNHKRVVTLEWNKEDIHKIYDTYFDEEEGIADVMAMPQDYDRNGSGNLADKVVNEKGELIGKSAGRIYTLYYKKVISMAFLEPKYAELGKEVTVIWGNPGTRQIPVRAVVARYPYLDMPRNKDFDLETIPHYKA